MKKLLFVISNINIGGSQKSLLALLDRLDYERFSVDVLALEPGGTLRQYYNPHVTFLEAPALVTAMTLPSGNIRHWLSVLVRQKRFFLLLQALGALAGHMLLRRPMNQQRQHLWARNGAKLPKLEGQYDVAFGILGLSTYYIADCVSAVHRYHWIRSDTRILNRDEQTDAAYFRKMTGFLSVSRECADIFEKVYPFSSGCMHVVYNDIPIGFYNRLDCDTSVLQRVQCKYKIMTVCRLDPLKGIEMAIDACGQLLARRFDICWFILGDGAYRAQIESMLQQRKIADRFILLGFQLNFCSRQILLYILRERKENPMR